MLPDNFIVDFEIRYHHLNKEQKNELTFKFIEKGLKHLKDDDHILALKSFEWALKVYNSLESHFQKKSIIYFIKLCMNDIAEELDLEEIYKLDIYMNEMEKHEIDGFVRYFGVSGNMRNKVSKLIIEGIWDKFNGC